MIKKFSILMLIAFSLLQFSSMAQYDVPEKANYRLAERFSPEKIKRMVFSTSVRPNWLETGDKFWYKYKTSEGENFYLVDLSKQSKTVLFDNHKMAAMITKITKDPYDWQHLPPINPKFKKNDTVFQFDVTSSTEMEEPKAEEEEENKKEEVIEKKEKDDDEKIEEEKKEIDGEKEKKDDEEDDEDKKEDAKKDKKPVTKEKPKKKVYHLEYNIQTGELYEQEDWKEEKKHPAWANMAPDSSLVVFARNYNLYWMDKENFLKAKEEKEDEPDTTIVEHQLTTEGVQHYAFGGGYTPKENDDEKTREKELKKRRGAYVLWSPDSKNIALTRSDNRALKALWVINVTKQPRPDLETYKYQMPGENDTTEVELWVFDMEKKEGHQIEVDTFANQTVSIMSENLENKDRIKNFVPRRWLSKSSDELFFSRASRDLHKIDICKIDLKTNEVKTLIEERLNTYIEQKTLHVLGSTGELVHWSERDGWAHFYLYDKDGNLKNQITSGSWHCNDIVKVDEKTRTLYFTANAREKGENPYYEHFYKVNLDGSGLTLLNKGNFSHSVVMSDSKQYFINNYSRVNTTPKTDVRDNKGNVVMELETADLSNLFAAGYQFPEVFKAKAADGITDIYGVMYKPFDFDSTRQYPILEYVYPGPQTEAVNATFSSRMDRTDRFAQLGFVIITLGNRGGHPNRSKWYHNYGYNDLRDYGLADKKYVVEQLADRHSFIDIERVGISGHSGGGFMSTAALLQYPDFYKAAVSSAGNHDNSIYNRWWSEKHHGVKEEINEKGEAKFIYDIEKNSELAKNLRGHLLLVTGDMDNNVHPGNTIRMANALIKAKKRFDFFIMPGQRHGFGEHTEYFFWLKADYFCKHLIGDYSISTDIFEMRREHKMTPSKKRAQ